MDPDFVKSEGLVSWHFSIPRRILSGLPAIRIVPNYELPPALEQVEILRVVVRENLTETVGLNFSCSFGC